MAVGTRARPDAAGAAQDPPRKTAKLGSWLLLGAVALITLMWVWPHLLDPRRLPAGPDMAWYTWRAELLTAHPPAALVLADGPLHVFGGGYRVTTPLLGALLRTLGGFDPATVSIFLVPVRQVLLALGLGAVAYRLRPSRAIFVSVATAASVVLFLRPFVGYVDNLMALLYTAAVLWFLPDAARRVPARFAIAALAFLLLLTHPSTALILFAVLGGAGAVHLVTERSLVRVLRTDGWAIGSTAAGAVAGLLAWLLGAWGPARSFRDAIHIPPYPSRNFVSATLEQLRELQVPRLLPLLLLGIAAVVVLARRRLRTDPLPLALLLGLVPFAGSLGFMLDLRYPYKRFMNSTAAPLVLVGLGVWLGLAVGLPALRRAVRSRSWVRAAAASALAGAVLFALGGSWAVGSRGYTARAQWQRYDFRISMGAIRAYLDADRAERPLVFVVSAGATSSNGKIWGVDYRGNWSQIRSGLPGRVIPDTHVWFGSARRLLEGRATRTRDPLIDLIASATAKDVRAAIRRGPPLVLMIDRLNQDMGNDRFLGPAASVGLGGGVRALRGPRFAAPDPGAVQAARLAARSGMQRFGRRGHLLARPLDLAAAAIGLAFVFVVPGLLAARRLGIRGLPMLVGMVPVVSVAMNVLAGFLVLALARGPLSPGLAWIVTAIATLGGAAMWLAARRSALATAGEHGAGEQNAESQR